MEGNPKGEVSSKPDTDDLLQDDKTHSPQDDQRSDGEVQGDIILKTGEAIGE